MRQENPFETHLMYAWSGKWKKSAIRKRKTFLPFVRRAFAQSQHKVFTFWFCESVGYDKTLDSNLQASDRYLPCRQVICIEFCKKFDSNVAKLNCNEKRNFFFRKEKVSRRLKNN